MKVVETKNDRWDTAVIEFLYKEVEGLWALLADIQEHRDFDLDDYTGDLFHIKEELRRIL